MVSPPRTFAGVVVLLGFLGMGIAFSQRPESAEAPPVVRAQAERASQVIGMAGCAATGCHGRTEVSSAAVPGDIWHESFSRWIDRDPHTRAYDVLESKLGEQIMMNLSGNRKNPPSATKDARCIACHANPSLATPTAMADERLNRLRSEGVSCEACHGNAERWQIAHTNWASKDLHSPGFDKHGMIDLNDWSNQAQTCVGCHIGAPKDDSRGYPVRDMNHDMIAAGHPRLEFEFVTFHQKLSKHWQPKHRSVSPDPGRDALLHGYVLGQIAVEVAYCDLSLDRIAARGENDSRRPYPEFADWNCSQCHHNLVPQPLRAKAAMKRAGASKDHLGRPVWIGASAVLTTTPTPTPLFKQSPDEQIKALTARKEQLKSLAAGVREKPNADVRKQLRSALETPLPAVALNWEEANRQYLALRSLAACGLAAGGSPSADASEHFGRFQLALWGKKGLPTRREFLDKSDPGYKGYQRKPESRWTWEKLDPTWRPLEEIVADLRKSLAGQLQNLPP